MSSNRWRHLCLHLIQVKIKLGRFYDSNSLQKHSGVVQFHFRTSEMWFIFGHDIVNVKNCFQSGAICSAVFLSFSAENEDIVLKFSSILIMPALWHAVRFIYPQMFLFHRHSLKRQFEIWVAKSKYWKTSDARDGLFAFFLRVLLHYALRVLEHFLRLDQATWHALRHPF